VSRLAASLLVVLVLAALATVLGEEVLLDGLHRRRVALLVGADHHKEEVRSESAPAREK